MADIADTLNRLEQALAAHTVKQEQSTVTAVHEATGRTLTLEVMADLKRQLTVDGDDTAWRAALAELASEATESHSMTLRDLETHGTVEDDDGNRYGLFTGWASVFGNVDATSEVIEPGAFSKTIKDNKGAFPLMWSHHFFDMPLGTVEVAENKRGLKVTEGKILLGRTVDGVFHASQRGIDMFALLHQKAIKAMSIGFRTLKEDVIDNIRHLKEIRLFEVSLVNFPANKRAVVTGVKTDLADTLADVAAAVEDHNGTVLDGKTAMVAEDIIEALTDLIEPHTPHSTEPSAAHMTVEPTVRSLTDLVADMQQHTAT